VVGVDANHRPARLPFRFHPAIYALYLVGFRRRLEHESYVRHQLHRALQVVDQALQRQRVAAKQADIRGQGLQCLHTVGIRPVVEGETDDARWHAGTRSHFCHGDALQRIARPVIAVHHIRPQHEEALIAAGHAAETEAHAPRFIFVIVLQAKDLGDPAQV
jgi:hypothetical protein